MRLLNNSPLTYLSGVYQIHRDRLEKWNAENGASRDLEEINDTFGEEEADLRL